MVFTASRAACALTFVLAIVTAPAALAHAHLKHQYPAADAEVVAAPQALTLNFSEGIEPKFSGISITGDKQQIIKVGTVKRAKNDKTQLIAPLEQALTPGTYQVDWHVVSVDGHKTKGSYHFSVK